MRYAWILFGILLPWQTIYVVHDIWLQGSKWQWGTVGWYATELYLWILFFIVLFHKNKLFKIQPSYQYVVVICMAIMFWIGQYVISADYDLAIQHGSRIIAAVILMGILSTNASYRKAVIIGCLASIIPITLLVIVQWYGQSQPAMSWLGLSRIDAWQLGTPVVETNTQRWLRVSGPFPHPNILGGYMVLYLTLLWQQFGKISFRISLGLSVLAGMLLVVSLSKSAVLAFVLLAIVTAMRTKKRAVRIMIFSTIAMCLLTSSLLWPQVLARLHPVHKIEVQSYSQREAQYVQAFQVAKAYFPLGTGLGNYGVALQKLYPYQPGWWYQPVHNSFMLFVLEGGILGLVVIVLVWYRYRPINYWWGTILILCPIWMFDHYLYTQWTMLLFTAIVLTHSQKNTSDTVAPLTKM